MIHYTCDGCQRPIDEDNDTRYVVRVEVYAPVEQDDDASSERDHLEEIDELLERADGLDAANDDLYKQVRFDVCSECREALLRNPLARLSMTNIGFSEN
ncbi:MAG: hypothetical protein AAGJ46_20270 [Planctomycetota bacterium]